MSPRSGAGGATVPGETRVILATVTPSVICDLHLSPCLFWPPHLWRLSLALPCHLCRAGRVCANLTPAHSGARKLRWLCKMLEPDAPHDKCVLCLAKSFPQHPVPLQPPPKLPAHILCGHRDRPLFRKAVSHPFNIVVPAWSSVSDARAFIGPLSQDQIHLVQNLPLVPPPLFLFAQFYCSKYRQAFVDQLLFPHFQLNIAWRSLVIARATLHALRRRVTPRRRGRAPQ